MQQNENQLESAIGFKDLDDFTLKQSQWIDIEQKEEHQFIQGLIDIVQVSDLVVLGYALNCLRILKVKQGLGGRRCIVMEYKDTIPQTLKFHAGDQVALYESSQGLLSQQSMKASCVIEYIKGSKIKLMTDQKQATYLQKQERKDHDDIEEKEEFDIKKYFCLAIQDNQVTYKRYKQVLVEMNKNKDHKILQHFLNQQHQLKSFQTCQGRILDIDIIPKLHEHFKSLNQKQQDAVTMCLQQPLFGLIHGPPGTGKTRTLCEFLFQSVVVMRQKILACAPSNIAVDNMIERLIRFAPNIQVCRIGHPARAMLSIRNCCIDILMKRTKTYQEVKNIKQQIHSLEKQLARATKYDQKRGLRKQLSEFYKSRKLANKLSLNEVLDESQIIFCTNAGAGDKMLRNREFDLVVIDECAQALEISCWIPILRGRKIVMAGDHKQLPPTIKSQKADKEGFGVTLFERTMNQIDQQQKNSILLNVQYRMNEKIMNWSSKEVYEGQLVADDTVKDHCIDDFNIQDDIKSNMILLVIDTSGCELNESEPKTQLPLLNLKDLNKSKYNEGESQLVHIAVKELLELHIKQEDIGVITPYSAQVSCIRSLFEAELSNVEVSTVDGFQGREKECIIISMVRSNEQKEIGFLSEYRRMNVAVTRAKRFVCLICNTDTVKQDKFLSNLIEYFDKYGQTRSAAMYNIQPTENKESNTLKQKKVKKLNQKQLPQNQQIQPPQNTEMSQEDQREEKYLSDYKQIVEKFIASDEKVLKVKQLNAYERKLFHSTVEKYDGIEHISEGTDKLKCIRLRKTPQLIVNDNDLDLQLEEVGQQFKTNQEPLIPPMKGNIFNTLKEDSQSSDEEQVAEPETKQVQEQQIKSKNKNKNKKKKKQKQMNIEQEEKVEIVQIEAKVTVILDPRLCQLLIQEQQCKQPLNILSIQCKFCNKTYCSKHHLAEYHGCEDQARQEARQKYLQEMQKDENEGKQHLQSSLKSKIKESQSKRSKKQAKK